MIIRPEQGQSMSMFKPWHGQFFCCATILSEMLKGFYGNHLLTTPVQLCAKNVENHLFVTLHEVKVSQQLAYGLLLIAGNLVSVNRKTYNQFYKRVTNSMQGGILAIETFFKHNAFVVGNQGNFLKSSCVRFLITVFVEDIVKVLVSQCDVIYKKS